MMKTKQLTGGALLGATLLFFFPVYTQDVCDKKPVKKISAWRHHGTHMAMQLVAVMGAIGCTCAGILSGAVLGVACNEVLKSVKLISEDKPYVISTVCIVPTLFGIISGLCLIYKMPQWTDKYILKLKTKRTQKQNILTFFTRFAFGVPLGEYLVEFDRKFNKLNDKVDILLYKKDVK